MSAIRLLVESPCPFIRHGGMTHEYVVLSRLRKCVGPKSTDEHASPTVFISPLLVDHNKTFYGRGYTEKKIEKLMPRVEALPNAEVLLRDLLEKEKQMGEFRVWIESDCSNLQKIRQQIEAVADFKSVASLCAYLNEYSIINNEHDIDNWWSTLYSDHYDKLLGFTEVKKNECIRSTWAAHT